ncbi:MAG: cytochrome b/b6 domain-containing protein [Rhodocyclaceae bacterium]|nr:cytochrome b/b6 domain-containing protein [Rhodocyclaceae bacterium]
MTHPRIRVWDLPTRIFHWVLVLLIAAMIVTGKVGGNLIDWHGRIGLALVALIAFRIVWGFAGSTYARFASFFPTPYRLRAYLRGEWSTPGHNPLGALSVFGLLGLIVLQLATGLIGNDDIAFRGPLFELVGKTLSDRATGLHKLMTNLLIALIVLHVAAIVFYARVKKDNLVKPMLTGWKEHAGRPASGGGIVAFIAAAIIGTGAAWGASGIWLPAPPPPPPSSTPAW